MKRWLEGRSGSQGMGEWVVRNGRESVSMLYWVEGRELTFLCAFSCSKLIPYALSTAVEPSCYISATDAPLGMCLEFFCAPISRRTTLKDSSGTGPGSIDDLNLNWSIPSRCRKVSEAWRSEDVGEGVLCHISAFAQLDSLS
jgi:hypothetical protein